MSVTGSPMVCLFHKLKALRCALRKWNLEVFGRIEQEMEFLEEKLVHLKESLLN